MVIIINTTTLIGSGVTQVAVSFLYECLIFDDNKYEYHVFLGKQVSKSINQKDFDSRFIFYSIHTNPLEFFKGGSKSIKKMKLLEGKIKPDVVFTIFGPSWWTPLSKHLQGFANPYYIYKDGPYFKVAKLKHKVQLFFYEKIHCFFLKRNGYYFVAETEFVSRGLENLLELEKDSVYTVSNTCNSFFRNFKDDKRIEYLPKRDKSEFRFISLCTMQDHKNLTILNDVVPLLLKGGYDNLKFILTIDDDSFKKNFDQRVKNNVINIGRIPPEDCPYLFNECDALFLPTLAECFTANYPEAMCLNKVILTSDLPFAKDICKDSAEYFNPLEAKDIVKSIIKIVENKNYRDNLILNGNKRLEFFSTPNMRAQIYLKILTDISNK